MRFDVTGKRIVIIKLESGEDILEGLGKELRKAGISNGVILTGVGSTTSYHVHVVKSTGLPPGNVFFKKEAPFDIVNIQGYVLDGRVHAHISFADAAGAVQAGGHLEHGCRILTFCTVTVMETGQLSELDTYNV
jgi:predicted DNA-binding protein with PD1-like motif